MKYTLKQKKDIITNWKKWGVLGDIDKLFEYYANTENCEFCNKKFDTTFDKCLDHDHITLNFRKVVCRGCNNNDNYIKLMNGEILYGRENKKDYDKQHYEKNKEKKKEQARLYRINNNEKIKEKQQELNKEKIECECGCVVNKRKLTRHKQSKKHINLMEQKQ